MNNSIATRFALIFLAILQVWNCQPVLSPIHGKIVLLNKLKPLGKFIVDLAGEDGLFESFANQWIIQGVANSMLSRTCTCSGSTILGRPGLLNTDGYFERIYSSLPGHSFVLFHISLFIMDNWSNGDYYQILLDDVPILTASPLTAQSSSSTDYCGDGQMDLIDTARVVTFHDQTTLKITIISHLFDAPSNAWLGIKNLSISLSSNNVLPDSKCSRKNDGTEVCDCEVGFYPNPNDPRTCLACDPTCYECFGPSETECLSCKTLLSFDGSICSVLGVQNCLFFDYTTIRCSLCEIGYMLAWGGGCISSCNPPYILNTTFGYSTCKTPCQSNNTYLHYNNTCVESCSSPLSGRIEGEAKFCEVPCLINDYLYSNGSCSSSCDFFARSEGNYKFCDSCPTGTFLYPNHTCLATCSLPWSVQGSDGYNSCVFPCQSNDTFMLWDNRTCVETCNPPLQPRIEGNAKFCDFSCLQYLYSNGSCLSSCDFFTRLEGASRFCDSCIGGAFLYPDHSCSSTCLSSGIAKIDSSGYNYCLSPCESDADYYYKKQTQCKSTCKYPNKVENSFSCVLDISEETIKSLEKLSDAMSITKQIAGVIITLSNLVSFSNPTAVLFGSMGDLIQYIKYLKINYPPKLQYLLDEPESEGALQVIFSVPFAIENLFSKKGLPEQFEKHDLHSSFVVNFWKAYVTIFIILSIIMLVNLSKVCTSRFQAFQPFLLKVKQMFQWNFLISQLIPYYGDMAFFAALEMVSLQFDSISSIFSLLVGLTTNIIALSLLIQIIYVIVKIIQTKIKDSRSAVFKRINIVKQDLEQYGIVFETFKDDSFVKQAFLLFYVVRLYIFNIFLSFLFRYPLIQTILFTLLSFAMLLYLVLSRPFKRRREFIENIVQEAALQIINICVLVLAALDAADYEAFDTREAFGMIIMGLNTGFSFLGSFYLNIQLILTLKNLYSDHIKRQKEKKEVQSEKISTIEKIESNQKVSSAELQLRQSTSQNNQLFKRVELQSNYSSGLNPSFYPQTVSLKTQKDFAVRATKRNILKSQINLGTDLNSGI